MASDHTPPKPGASTSRAAERQAEIEARREAKLAQALRANLRRRKAEPRSRAEAGPARPDDGDSA